MTKGTPKSVTVHVPMKFSTRGGRKAIITEAVPASPAPSRTEEALLKALAKAFRWRQQIEAGEFASISELAKSNGINDSYACRILRLTLLAPDIVTTALDGRDSSLTLKALTRPLENDWTAQRQQFGKNILVGDDANIQKVSEICAVARMSFYGTRAEPGARESGTRLTKATRPRRAVRS